MPTQCSSVADDGHRRQRLTVRRTVAGDGDATIAPSESTQPDGRLACHGLLDTTP